MFSHVGNLNEEAVVHGVLHMCSKVVVMVVLPDEVKQSISRAHDCLAAVLGVLFLGCATRMDDGDHDDPHYHGHKGGPQVIRHCDQTKSTGTLGVEGGES